MKRVMVFLMFCYLPMLSFGAEVDDKGASGESHQAAAPLVVKQWLAGQPVQITEGDAVYVLHFRKDLNSLSSGYPSGAELDGHNLKVWDYEAYDCFIQLPHLLKEFETENVVFVSIGREPDYLPAKVNLPGICRDPRLHVGFDSDDATFTSYLDESDLYKLPMAFVVDRNAHVVWAGHPNDYRLEDAIDRALTSKTPVFQSKEPEKAQDRPFIGVSPKQKIRDFFLD